MSDNKNLPPTKYGIVGFGCIGSYLCHLFDDNNTTVFVRHPRLTTNSYISNEDKQYTLKAKVCSFSALNLSNIDVLIIPIKSYQNEQLIAQIKHIIPITTQIVLLQNGISGIDQFKTAFPQNAIFAGLTTDGIYRLSKTSVKLAGEGSLLVGLIQTPAPMSNKDKANVMQLVKIHPNGKWCEDISLAIHKKLLINAVINPLTFIEQCKNGRLAAYQTHSQAIIDEVLLVFAALSIAFDKGEWSKTVFEVIKSTGNNTSSMLQDRQNQQATEVDAILGALIKKATLHKVNTPLLNSLYDQVKTIEAGYLANK